MPRSVALVSLALLLACSHTEPFSTPSTATDQPFNPSPPVRLTLNPGDDRVPAWLADGSAILYSAQRAVGDHDRCLAVLPQTGGQQQSLWCDFPRGADWTDAFLAAAVAPDGRLAYISASSTLNGSNPELLEVRVSPALDPRAGSTVRRLPYPSGSSEITAAAQLRWLGADRLAMLAQRWRFRKECNGCTSDTLLATIGIDVLSVAEPSTPPAQVPGTGNATGVAPVGTDALLYTLVGDTRVYRRDLTSGTVDVVRDFGAEGIARDVDLAGSRLAVVVGGVVGTELDPELGTIQWDSGGVVHVLDLAGGGDVAVPATGRLYRRPALSPAGDRLVAEGYPYAITQSQDPLSGTITVDTIMTPVSDLFLVEGGQ
jgi:hypothetical protein